MKGFLTVIIRCFEADSFLNLVILVRYNGTRKFSLKDRVIGSCKVPTQ